MLGLGAPIHMGLGPNAVAAGQSQEDVEAKARAEAEEIRRIEEAAKRATASANEANLPRAKKQKGESSSGTGGAEETQGGEDGQEAWQPMRLEDEDGGGLEAPARWKEGTG